MLFGGFESGSFSSVLSRIAAYNPHTDEWTSKGDLLSSRARPGVIAVNDELIIFGGYIDNGQRSSEKCRNSSKIQLMVSKIP